jgi:hypothetical protein
MARAIRSSRGSGTSRTLQDGVEGLGQVVRPEEGELPGGEEVGEGGATGGDGLGEGFACKPTIGTTTGATGGDGLGEGEEEVQQDPHPPASFEVDRAGLPRDLDPDWRWPRLGPSPRRLRPG